MFLEAGVPGLVTLPGWQALAQGSRDVRGLHRLEEGSSNAEQGAL